MNNAAIIEYVNLCDQLEAALLTDQEGRLYDRLDQLWYSEMTEDDRIEADRRLAANRSKDKEKA